MPALDFKLLALNISSNWKAMTTAFLTADLFDAYPHCASCETQLQQYGGRKQFFGRIRTVRCIDDNVLIRRMLETTSDGEILIVDGGGYLGSALIGDVIAGIAADNGWAGVIIYGATRCPGASERGSRSQGSRFQPTQKC